MSFRTPDLIVVDHRVISFQGNISIIVCKKVRILLDYAALIQPTAYARLSLIFFSAPQLLRSYYPGDFALSPKRLTPLVRCGFSRSHESIKNLARSEVLKFEQDTNRLLNR